MGLLTTYDKNNRVVTNDKVVSYSMNMIRGTWGWSTGPASWYEQYYAYEFHRYCTKTYTYVGMDLATANACAAAAVTYYTRDTKTSLWNWDAQHPDQFWDKETGRIPMADVCIQQMQGHMYQVIISVREDDARIRLQPLAQSVPISSLFTAEEARGYDTGDNAFQ